MWYTGTPRERRLFFQKMRDTSRCVPRKKQMEDFVLSNTLKLRSGATIRRLTRAQADAKNYLTREVLAMLPKYDGEKVVYGTGCRLSDARLRAEKITFKQIPYDLRG